jgi:hypothetical protein
MWLMIDDQRNLNCELEARTAAEGRALLIQYAGQIECLCLDHDLGPCPVTGINQESGYDIALWALMNEIMPPRVQLVSANPVGRQNIANALGAYGYITRDGINFEQVGVV